MASNRDGTRVTTTMCACAKMATEPHKRTCRQYTMHAVSASMRDEVSPLNCCALRYFACWSVRLLVGSSVAVRACVRMLQLWRGRCARSSLSVHFPPPGRSAICGADRGLLFAPALQQRDVRPNPSCARPGPATLSGDTPSDGPHRDALGMATMERSAQEEGCPADDEVLLLAKGPSLCQNLRAHDASARHASKMTPCERLPRWSTRWRLSPPPRHFRLRAPMYRPASAVCGAGGKRAKPRCRAGKSL